MPLARMSTQEQDEPFESVNLAELAKQLLPRLKAWSTRYGLIILILIPLLLSILIRLQPIGYPGIEDHARARPLPAGRGEQAL